jgi:SNF2-related domain
MMNLMKRRLATGAEEEILKPAELEKKWSNFTDLTWLVLKSSQAYAALGGLLAHNSFFEGGGRTRPSKTGPQLSLASMTEKFKTDGRVLHKALAAAEGITLAIELPHLSCYLAGALPEPTGPSAQARIGAEKILRTLFPSFDLSKLPLSENHVSAAIPPQKLPLEAIAAIQNNEGNPLELGDMPKELRGIISFSLQPFDIEVVGSSIATSITPHMSVHFYVGVTMHVKLPIDYCAWCTSSDKSSVVVPQVLSRFIKRWRWYTAEDPKGKPPLGRVPNLAQNQQVEAETTQKFGLQPKKMTDQQGICSLPDGRLVWVPEVGRVDYANIMNSCFKPLAPNDPPDSMREIDFTPVKNRNLVASWLTNKMIITDANGEAHMEDLTGARPPSRIALAHTMRLPVDGDIFAGMVSLADKVGVSVPAASALAKAGIYTFDEAKITWENFLDRPFLTEESDREVAINQGLYQIGKFFAQAYTALTSSDIPTYEQYEIRPFLALYGVYAGQLPAARDEMGMQAAQHLAPVDPEKPPVAQDMPGLASVLPHQQRVFSEIDMMPKGCLIAVDAGGGKTPTIAKDIATLMFAGKIHRPAVVMPRNLLAQFATELNEKFCKGQFKMWLIDNYSWGRIAKSYKKGDDLNLDIKSYVQVIKSQPKNTIFLIDYNWLVQQRVELGVDDSVESYYPRSAIIDQCEFDYITADESHKTKNRSAGRTKAVGALYAGVASRNGYTRASSGTILHDTIKDIVGQMSLIEPLALGDVGKYLSEGGERNAVMQRKQREYLAPFTRKITVKRREWAHLLPTLRQNIHLVRMTPKQQQFNDTAMKQALAGLAQDPKLKKLMEQDPEKAEKKIAALFSKQLAKLEIWINAPDTQADNQYGGAFVELEGITDTDMISRKVAKIDEIIEKHLNGGQFNAEDDKVIQIKPDPNKILVLGYNKETSLHLFKHSRYANMGIHYSAGNDAAITEWLKDDPTSPKILFADLGSITEGKNFQIASRMIVTQIVWTPGTQEQLAARIWRPDVPDKSGKVKYPRDYVWIDFVIFEPSVEIPKMARLIAKQVDNMRAQEEDDNPSLKALINENEVSFSKIKKIKMNIAFIEENALTTVNPQGSKSIVRDQFVCYQIVKGWEEGEFDKTRVAIANKIKERTGQKPNEKNLAADSMVPVTNQSTPEFTPPNALQPQGYSPWTSTYTGLNQTSLHLVPLSILLEQDSEEDEGNEDDDGEEEETITAQVGDPVLTQYGLGWIVAARAGSKKIKVSVPGFGEDPLILRRTLTLGASNDVDREALRKILQSAGKNGLPVFCINPKGRTVQIRSGLVPENQIAAIKKSLAKTGAFRPSPEARKAREEQPIVRTRVGIDLRKRREPVADEDVLPKRMQPGGVGRAPGLDKDPLMGKPNNAPPPTPVPAKQPAPGNRPAIPQPKPVPTPIKKGRQEDVFDLTNLKDEDTWDVREGEAALINGTVCVIVTDPGKSSDPILIRLGFQKINTAVRIRAKNPAGYDNIVAYLTKKFVMPRDNIAALDHFGELYAARKTNVAYLKPKEASFHALWIAAQKKKASDPNGINPWPVVEVDNEGKSAVYVYMDLNNHPAVKKLSGKVIPGAYPPKKLGEHLIMMVRSVADAKTLIGELKKKKVKFGDERALLDELRSIRG